MADLARGELEDLERKARAATPGPWTRKKPSSDTEGWAMGVAVAGTPGRQTVYANPPGGSFPSADCDFIAAANPAVVLALIAAAKERDELRAEVDAAGAERCRLHGMLKRLRGELERAKDFDNGGADA